MLDNWQRIEKIFEWSRTSSINAFARSIGLNRGENLYQIKKGNNGISRDLAEQITGKFPEISKGWLLSGEGNMLHEDNKKGFIEEKDTIPFYEKNVIEVLTSKVKLKALDNLVLSSFKDCDLAAISYGEAMHPHIPNGSTVLIKQIPINKILPGDDYIILSTTFVGIRRVRREHGSDILRLEARNENGFDDILIDVNDINEIYVIKGVITKITM